ncbi:MAG: DUF1559 domain-containing protein, partial [Planctomycetia bacterium]
MAGQNHARGAFTLVELLVVIGIIGVLVGLILPAVQAARESARRSACTNNLKQIALASHTHLSTHNTFPMGCRINNSTGVSRVTWAVWLLPFVEQQDLYNSIDLTVGEGGTSDSVTGPSFRTWVSGYQCGSDQRGTCTVYNTSNPYSRSNYVASFGGSGGIFISSDSPFTSHGPKDTSTNLPLFNFNV